MSDTPDYKNGEPEPKHVEGGPSMHDLLVQDLSDLFEKESVGREVQLEILGEVLHRKYYGLHKYGTILQAHNGRKPLKDAVEEVVDLCVYLRQASIEEPENENIKEAYDLAVKTLVIVILTFMSA